MPRRYIIHDIRIDAGIYRYANTLILYTGRYANKHAFAGFNLHEIIFILGIYSHELYQGASDTFISRTMPVAGIQYTRSNSIANIKMLNNQRSGDNVMPVISLE